MIIFYLPYLLLFLVNSQCVKNHADQAEENTVIPRGYYSDYFVFIADDELDPLVIPVDINWTLHTEGYEIEYKSWYGTAEEWPIAYLQKNIIVPQTQIPKEAFDHLDTELFSFNDDKRSIATSIQGAPKIEFQVPEEEQWVLGISDSDFPTYAFKTSVDVAGAKRTGWMIYERIRFKELGQFVGFAAFYWMPIVVDGMLYHFTQHRGEQTAAKWSAINGQISSETIEGFELEVIETISDVQSGRKVVPKVIRLSAEAWEVDLNLKSTGEQVGYGEDFPNGLAYFRQSLLQPISTINAYGMMELILADD